MTRLTPLHATLPLWQNKTQEQRQETLTQMMSDLSVYAVQKAIPCPSVDITQPNDAQKEKVMEAYRAVLGNDLKKIIYSLDKVIAFDETEKEHISAIRSFVNANPNALNMNCENGHLTGSALILHPQTKRVLLHRHKKLGIWLQFGGHPDYETNITDVARREAMEESGLNDLTLVSTYNDLSIPIDVDMHIIPEKKEIPAHYHADMRFFFTTNTPEKIDAADGESADFWWITTEEAKHQPENKIPTSVHRLIKKAEIYFNTFTCQI